MSNGAWEMGDVEYYLPKDESSLFDEHRHLAKLHEAVTPEARQAISAYSGQMSRDINRDLIYRNEVEEGSDEADVHKSLLEHIDQVAPLTQTHHVYSGTGYDPHFENEIIKTPAWTSASIHPLVARSFTQSPGDKHIIHFELPTGYNKGAYIASKSEIPNEHEFLLKPNQKWKLTNHVIHKIPQSNYKEKHNLHVWSVKPHE